MNKANKHREGRGEESAAYEMFSEWASHTNIKIQQADWGVEYKIFSHHLQLFPTGWLLTTGQLDTMLKLAVTLYLYVVRSLRRCDVWSEEAGGGRGNGLQWKCWNCGSNLIGLCSDCHQLWRINSLASALHICNPICDFMLIYRWQ